MKLCTSVDKWGYLEDDGCTASFGLATDEYLARNLPLTAARDANTAGFSHTIRLYTYGERCALVGKYQDAYAEIDLQYCATNDTKVNRRPTGGGAIIMGEGQLGVAMALPLPADFSFLKLTLIFEMYSRGIILGLRRLGISAEFRPKNDLLVRGKKIAGLAFATIGETGLFHASILADLNEEVMLRVLRIPQSKKTLLTTISRESGRTVSTSEVREAVKEGCKEAFSVGLINSSLSPIELQGIELLERAKYKNPLWIFGQEGSVGEYMGDTCAESCLR